MQRIAITLAVATLSVLTSLAVAGEAPSIRTISAASIASHQALRTLDSSSSKALVASQDSCENGNRIKEAVPYRIRHISEDQNLVVARGTPFCEAVATQKPSSTKHRSARSSHGRTRYHFPEDNPDVRHCVALAAQKFGIKPMALYLILDVEGGRVGHTSSNSNGTYDIGPAQINSSWLEKLAKRGITEKALRDNLCTNIKAGAWIYDMALKQTGTMVQALAVYHSPTRRYQMAYLKRINKAIGRRLAMLDTHAQKERL